MEKKKVSCTLKNMVVPTHALIAQEQTDSVRQQYQACMGVQVSWSTE